MTMTMTLTDLLLMVIAVAVVFAVFKLIQIAERVARSTQEVQDTLRRLGPQVEQTLAEASALLAESRSLVGRLDGVAADASSISRETTDALVPWIHDLQGLRRNRYRIGAVMKGIRVGAAALLHRDDGHRRDEEHSSRAGGDGISRAESG